MISTVISPSLIPEMGHISAYNLFRCSKEGSAGNG